MRKFLLKIIITLHTDIWQFLWEGWNYSRFRKKNETKQCPSDARSNTIFQNLKEKLLSYNPLSFLNENPNHFRPITFSTMVANKNTLGIKWAIWIERQETWK